MSETTPSPTPSIALVQDDPWLGPYEADIVERRDRCRFAERQIAEKHGSLHQFAQAHHQMGIHYDAQKQVWHYREWAPAAEALSLVGDFNQWDREANAMQKDDRGIWYCEIPGDQLKHGDLVKVHVKSPQGEQDRIPAYIRRTVQDPETHDFSGQVWSPQEEFQWTDQAYQYKPGAAPLIYECHVGMAQEKEGVGTWAEFADHVLPRIHALGYNAIQMMAVQEHPYYGSFGYHVSNFFAPSSRFGTPEDLKALIDKAHNMGIAVIMDIVHSHAVKNLAEGLNEFDGSDDQYFHPGGRGEHDGWDSKLFNYGK
ncbi:MAG: alpha-amylase family glycosyl hydrolase, partial [Bacteroidota bacterium]